MNRWLSGILLSLTFVLQLNAQKLYRSRHTSYYMLYYRISDEQAVQLQESPYKCRHWLRQLSGPMDSIPKDSVLNFNRVQQWGYGHYVGVYTEGGRLRYTYQQNQPVEAVALNNHRDLMVRVYDQRDGHIISNATVMLGKRKIPWDPVSQTYILRKSNAEGSLRILSEGHTALFNLIRKRDNPWIKRTGNSLLYGLGGLFRHRYRPRVNGYFITSQPKYLPGDTVKVKAYVLDRNGRPVNYPARLQLYNPSTYTTHELVKDLRPASDGAFVYQFVLGDSLKVDYTYQLHLYAGRKLMDCSFRLEDYQLDETSYFLTSHRNEFYEGDTLRFKAIGTDANGNILPDARVKISVNAMNVFRFFSDTVFIPDILWEKEITLNPADSTLLEMPAPLHFPVNMTLQVKATFNNANNETHDTAFSLTFYHLRQEIKARRIGNNIRMEYLENGVSKPRYGYYEWSNVNHYAEKHETDFPRLIPADPKFTVLRMMTDSISGYYNQSGQHGVYIESSRTADSVFFRVYNPLHLPLTCTLLRKGVRQSDRITTDSLVWALRDRSKTSYRMECQFMFAGSETLVTSDANLSDKLLNVQINQPEKIYPGQTVPVTIQVTDFRGKPVSDVNLTAFGINKQFGQPTLPNTLQFQEYNMRSRTINDFTIGKLMQETSYYGNRLDSLWRKRFQLDSILYYKMLYPEDGYYQHTEPTDETLGSVSVFLVHDGNKIPVYMMSMDNRLFYYADAIESSHNYLCTGREGYHRITLRTYDREYSIDSVYIRAGHKTDISLDTSYRSKHIYCIKRTPYLNYYELKNLRESMLVLNVGDYYYNSSALLSSAWIWQNDRVYHLQNPASSFRHNRYAFIGPVMKDSLHWFSDYAPKQPLSFIFENGYAYQFHPPMVKMKYDEDLFTPDDPNYIQRKGYPIPTWATADAPFGVIGHSYTALMEHIRKPKPLAPKRRSQVYTFDKNRWDITGVYQLNSNYSYSSVVIQSLQEDATYIHPRSSNVIRLKPGWYRISLVSETGDCFVHDSLFIRANGIFYDRLNHPAGKDQDTVNLPGYWQYQHAVPQAFRPGIGRFSPEPDTRFHRVSGSVKDSRDDAVPLMLVQLERYNQRIPGRFEYYPGSGELWSLVTSPDGEFSFNHIPHGMYRLRMVYEGIKIFTLDTVIRIGGDTSGLLLQPDATKLDEFMKLYARTILTPPTYFIDGIELREVDREYLQLGNVSLEEVQVVSSRKHYRNKEISSVTGWDFKEGKQGGFENGLPLSGLYSVNLITGGIPAKFGDQLEVIPGVSINGYLDGDTDIPVLQPMSALRTRFTDQAYWQPNLVTNARGEATFNVTFPDNITGWQCYVLAMNGHKQGGTGSAFTRAFKELAAILTLPRFMVEGDEASVIGKTVNYTGQPQTVHTQFELENTSVWEKDSTIENVWINTYNLQCTGGDSLHLVYRCRRPDGYMDGEKRVIPVYPQGTLEALGHFWKLQRDTTLQIRMEHSTGEYTVYVTDNVLTDLLQDAEDVRNYPYSCMEQTASRLKALIAEKTICRWAGRPFHHENLIRKMLQRLEKNQKTDGSWGWWENSPTNVYMTTYITDALRYAARHGYTSPALEKAQNYLYAHLQDLRGYDLLRSLNCLSGSNHNVGYETFLDTLQKTFGNAPGITYEKLQMLAIRQANKLPYDLSLLEQNAKTSLMGGMYWGTLSTHWYNNSLQYTLLAYKLIEARDSSDSRLPLIRDYLLELRTGNQWRNTVERSSVLETILPALLKTPKEKIQPVQMKLSGTLTETVSQFPYHKKVQSPQLNLSVTKTGTGSGYFTVYERRWNSQPQPVDSLYKVTSVFKVNGKTVDHLKAGEVTELEVTIEAKSYGEYVMIEIPIPAGCSYGDNRELSGDIEVHREYLKNKVSVFCESLAPGTYTYRILLEPRFTGKYTLNPAKVELMYFPTFFGRNALRKVSVVN